MALFVINQPRQKMLWLGLSLFVILLDQLTKWWAVSTLAYADPVAFLQYFNFTLLHNFGAAFSFLADQSGWQRFLLSGIALGMSVFLLVWILRIDTNKPQQKKIEVLGLALVLGGAIGNVWDRIQLGYVVDFIDWFYHSPTNDCLPFFYSIFSTQSCHWPAFNIADAAILMGALCLVIDMFIGGQRKIDQ